MAQKHFTYLPKQPKPTNGKRLLGQLVLAGRVIRCESRGCGCVAADELEVHHIMPLVVRRDHTVGNLAVLCKNHHALVERYYWQVRCQQAPAVTAEIATLLARLQHERLSPEDHAALCARLRELWDALNGSRDAQDARWWQRLYKNALTWAATQEVVRYVHAGQAIVADPWYRPKVSA